MSNIYYAASYKNKIINLLLKNKDFIKLMNPTPSECEDLDIVDVLIGGEWIINGKKWEEQIRIAKEVLHSTRHNEDVRKLVKGLMIESYIEDGCQKADGGVYGKSITDPCLGWEKTEKLIMEIAELRRK